MTKIHLQPPPPRISIIVPARNERQDIDSCISSLIAQDYSNTEIILVDDSSTDETADIMESFATKYENVSMIHAGLKPSGWMGKTWACVQGMEKATGDILLFTDADTKHAKNTLSDTIHYMMEHEIDALTITQKLLIPEMWTAVTMPVISSFKLAYPNGLLRSFIRAVNDPNNKKIGGMFGAYFMVKRKVYLDIGGFESVKNEILEDWVIGNKIKSAGYAVKIADGSHLVDAIWARDLPTLKEIFKRLMISFAVHDRKKGVRDFILIALLLTGPSIFLPYSVINYLIEPRIEYGIMLGSGIVAMLSYMISFKIHAKLLGIKLRHIFISPLGGFVATLGFLAGLIGTKRGHDVDWHDRIINVADM